ncbi:Fatty acid hydroxylase [Cordyceps militaris]|uniref:Fatty acid hydroxylase n=1 Tax=Cordyceps militaris TaxID=73501 RepID=A0A2H4SS69_CORMI|nr:Fatty acid hydroxylase [Cordyceps militaris]
MATETIAATGNVKLNKDSMRSTWRAWDKSQHRFAHQALTRADVFHNDLHRAIPVHAKTDPVPYLPQWAMQRWIVTHAAGPLLLHQLFVSATGANIGRLGALAAYYVSSRWFMTRLLRNMREMGHRYGHLDGDVHARDEVPDNGVGKTLLSVVLASVVRAVMFNVLTWDNDVAPGDARWLWMPLIIGVYGIVLDFWFYWYHRLMHDSASLWQFHRTHHLTKHPVALLTLYADGVQEVGDIVVIPLLAFLTLKATGVSLNFYEWYACNIYLNFAESLGHSGLRIMAYVPNPLTPVLKLFGAELAIEDHDLHHRRGWKSSFNYGKQTRLWDRVFGTCTARVECLPDNIDYKNQATMPWF